jgi:uncharacterized glyoxalase superfamily protein PhnB
MIKHAQFVTVPVKNQDEALDFYKNKLGFEVLTDVPFGNGMRWLEVAPPGAQTRFTLFTPPGFEDRVGTFTGISFATDDIHATFQQMRDRGVTFTEEPTEQPWGGIQAQFVDQDGNGYVLHS